MADKRHIVALSGGKDSTAMALRLAETEPREYVFLCTPTGNELPEMIDHWLRLGELLGTRILPVTGTRSLSGLIRQQKMLPNNRARFCTRMLKLEPYYRWLREQAPCVSYVGLRADEETRKGMIFPEGKGIEIRTPLREWGWGVNDVQGYLDSRGVRIPARTDCAICFHQTLGEWWRLWKLHPDLYAEGEALEAEISAHRGQQCHLRNKSRDTWPAPLKDLRKEFEAGHIPPRTVQQIDAFAGEARRSHTGICRVCSL